MTLLDKLLPKLKADGHRVLIFSQFRIVLNIIEDYMRLRNFSFERIDGAITGKKRQQAIDRFCGEGAYKSNSATGDAQKVEEIFAVLLSTRAGMSLTLL